MDQNADNHIKQWFVFLPDQTFRAFDLSTLSQMVQNRSLSDMDFVTDDPNKGWVRFKDSQLKQILMNQRPQRRYPRYSVKGLCIVVAEHLTFMGNVLSISNGGLMMEVNTSSLTKGQKINILVRPAFNFFKPVLFKGIVVDRMDAIPDRSEVHFLSRHRYIVKFFADLTDVSSIIRQ